MAYRYFVAPVIGTGTKADPYRLEVAVAGISYAAILPTGPTGAPVFGWGMARVSATDFATLDANANIVGSVQRGFSASAAMELAQLMQRGST